MKIGIISDTHDLLRAEVIEHLQGCEVILHAGDLTSRRILDRLQNIAPVLAARGNCDYGDSGLAERLPLRKEAELAGKKILIVHRSADIPRDAEKYDLVVYGHSHAYSEEEEKGVLYLNPGSCGPGRFGRPVTMALADLSPEGIRIEKIEIGPGPGR